MTIWLRPIRDLTTFPPSRYTPPEWTRGFPATTLSYPSVPRRRIDLTGTRAAIPRAVRACVRECVRACGRAWVRARTNTRTWRSDACTCRVVHFENPTRSYLPCGRHDSREENLWFSARRSMGEDSRGNERRRSRVDDEEGRSVSERTAFR